MLLFISRPDEGPLHYYDSNTSHVIVYPIRDPCVLALREFKYISCYCLSGLHEPERQCETEFKYISCYCLSWELDRKGIRQLLFKYISCYCLSPFRRHSERVKAYSNTSHVIVYRRYPDPSSTTASYSNTSHVIVYLEDVESEQRAQEFKYISCYCLSKGYGPERWCNANSNTSHVIVYRKRHCGAEQEGLFKYISCYCLSEKRSSRFARKNYSNTSHVIVYLRRPPDRYRWSCIQIHLMLLFISFRLYTVKPVIKFKYISCYCLSEYQGCQDPELQIQIHLMLLFIRLSNIIRKEVEQFKYISCYCLSGRAY